jgi:cysteine desulfurase
MPRIYLDYNATTPVAPDVLDGMLPFLSGDYGNAASIHTPGQRARAALDTARQQVAALIGARPQEIVFTSGGTESDNHAVFGAVAATEQRPAHVITTAIEHEAVLHACEELERQGILVTFVGVSRAGVVDVEAVRSAIRLETVLISVMHANNEAGSVQPIAELGRLARQHKIVLHTDAVQSAGKITIDVNALGVDLLTLSAHKFYGPKGIGALYVRSGSKVRQILFGGHHQRGFRPGTENVAGAVGMGKAAEIAREQLHSYAERVTALRDRLEAGILQRVPDCNVNGAAAERVANTTNFCFSGIEGEALVIALDLKGIAISTGAACSSGAVEPSHVLLAMGLTADEARSSVRFSLGRHTTPQEIDSTVEAVTAAVTQLRAVAPGYADRTSAAR